MITEQKRTEQNRTFIVDLSTVIITKKDIYIVNYRITTLKGVNIGDKKYFILPPFFILNPLFSKPKIRVILVWA